MKSFIDVLEQLEKTTGTNDKISIIRSNSSDELEKFLFLSLDDRITFGVKKFTYSAGDSRFDDVRAFENFDSLACVLSKRDVTGQLALDQIAKVFGWFSPLQQKWFEKCLQKDLASIGLGASNVNKAFGRKFILDFACSGAKQEKDIDKMVYPADAQWKVNGFRTFFFTDKDGKRANSTYSELLSPVGRSGLPIPNFDFLWPYIEELGLSNKVIDGEVECDDNLQEIQSLFGFDLTLTIADFTNAKGKVSKDWDKYQERRDEVLDIQSRAKFRIFEVLDKDEFENENVKDDYFTRMKYLISKVHPLIKSDKISIVESCMVKNKEEAYAVADRYIKSGKEGIVLKSHSGKYGFTKDNSQIKIKCKTEDIDCKIVTFEFAKTSYKTDGTPYPPMVGRVIVRYVNDRGEIKESGVGTGKFLTRATKLHMAEWPELYVDRIVVCTSQEFTKDEGVMSCPRIDSIRPLQDKNKI